MLHQINMIYITRYRFPTTIDRWKINLAWKMKTVVLWGQKERTFWARWFLQRVWNVIPWLVILMLCPSGVYTVNEDTCGQALCPQGVGPKVPSVFGMLSTWILGITLDVCITLCSLSIFPNPPKADWWCQTWSEFSVEKWIVAAKSWRWYDPWTQCMETEVGTCLLAPSIWTCIGTCEHGPE